MSVPVTLAAAPSSAIVEIVVSNRFTVRAGADVEEQHLARVIRMLEALG